MALHGCKRGRGGEDSIDAYMAEIGRYGRITREEEGRLSRLVRKGGEEGRLAREKLVCANLRLVVKLAHGFKGCGMGLGDLVAEGNVGLLKAVERFDPDNGAKFSVYAAWWIKQKIRRSLTLQAHVVRIPRGSSRKALLVGKAAAELAVELGREASDGELAERLGMAAGVVKRLRGVKAVAVSLSESVEEGAGVPLENVLESRAAEGVDAWGREMLHNALDGLEELDRKAVELVWGLDGGDAGREDLACVELGVGLRELGEVLRRAMERIRNFMEGRAWSAAAAFG